MTVEVCLAKVGFSMSEGRLVEWLVNDGDKVNEDQAIYTVESEKAIEEITSPASGIIRIKKEAGEVYKVGEVLGEIE